MSSWAGVRVIVTRPGVDVNETASRLIVAGVSATAASPVSDAAATATSVISAGVSVIVTGCGVDVSATGTRSIAAGVSATTGANDGVTGSRLT
jgi:hypothetical protein